MNTSQRTLILLFAGALAIGQGPLAFAEEDGQERGISTKSLNRHDLDHERAHEARLRGEIQPMAKILSQIGEQIPGEVIGIELEQEKDAGQGVWIYELKILTPDGRRLEVEVDARDGRLLELEDDD
ncbi:MAG: PepSY domain-containing protein [Chromatiaceae bacterium]|nr:PepSY domain-containing protein [Chromatiaceae bacterium]